MSGMSFHWRHNVFFARLDDGSVRISRDVGVEPYGLSSFDFTIPAAEWASIITAVSSKPTDSADDITARLYVAAVASCECQTKTPGHAHHHRACRYRVLVEAAEAIERLRGEMTLAAAPRNQSVCVSCDGAVPHRAEGRVRLRCICGVSPNCGKLVTPDDGCAAWRAAK
jgi:hypothetical protein